MGDKAILRVAKLAKRGNIGGSSSHNYRERPAHNADPSRSHLNEFTGAQSREELFAALDARLKQIDEVDPQAVPLVEFVITASPEAFPENGGKVDSKSYFDDAENWLKKKYGAENILGTCRHYDEKTPHMHAYVVPVRQVEAGTRKRSVIVGKDENGKTKRETREYPMPARSILSAKHHFDGRGKLAGLQTQFAKEVGEKYGLERGIEGSQVRHQTLKQFYANISQPVAPVPRPPRISGADWLSANSILDDYEKELGAALKPLFAHAKMSESYKNQASKADDYVNRTAQLEQELEKLNAKNRQLAANFSELEHNYNVLYSEHDALKEAYALLEKALERSKAEEKRLLNKLYEYPDFDQLSM